MAQVMADDARARNAQAQARHRAKRKAYIATLEATVADLQNAIQNNGSGETIIQQLQSENARLRREISFLRSQMDGSWHSDDSDVLIPTGQPGTSYSAPPMMHHSPDTGMQRGLATPPLQRDWMHQNTSGGSPFQTASYTPSPQPFSSYSPSNQSLSNEYLGLSDSSMGNSYSGMSRRQSNYTSEQQNYQASASLRNVSVQEWNATTQYFSQLPQGSQSSRGL